MKRLVWSELNPKQVGKYAEYVTQMEFTQHGFDVYSAEIDDKGIDFILRRENNGSIQYYDVQVKSIRESGYIFFPKSKFKPINNLLAAIVIFMDNESAKLYLIPSLAWKSPDALLVSHDYEGKQSDPEWGINISKKNMPLIERFAFHDIVKKI
jgi:hypothetical protein